MARTLRLDIQAQPDDSTCGPTCLEAVYDYYEGDAGPDLAEVVAEVEMLPTGGTLAVNLALHAMARGYRARIHPYNLSIFDPTWFAPPLPNDKLRDKLLAQKELKAAGDPKFATATDAYVAFLEQGGELRQGDLVPDLIVRPIKEGHPVLAGLSATWLYGCAREAGGDTLHYDDVAGTPMGHFVVLSGYDPAAGTLTVSDPLRDNPLTGQPTYRVRTERVLAAILLGVTSYDANLLVLEPPA